MANYYKNRYNLFIDHLKEIYEYLTGVYMDAYENRLLDCGRHRIELGNMQFLRILKYRRTDSVQFDLDCIRSAMHANIRYCSGLGAAFGYFVVSRDKEVSIFIAIEEESVEKFVSNMESVIPGIEIKRGFISREELAKLSSFSGIINGNVALEDAVIDKVLSFISNMNGVIALLAKPMKQQEISDLFENLSGLKLISEDLMYYGASNDNRNYRCNYSYVAEMDAFLEKSTKYYENFSEVFWRCCTWFGCESFVDLEHLGNELRAVLNSHNKTETDRARCYYTTESPLQSGCLFLPLSDYCSLNYELSIPKKHSLISYISTSDLVSLVQFPTYSVNGFEVVDMEKGKNAVKLFDTDFSTKTVNGIPLGTDRSSGRLFSLNLNDLTEHLLITGATGTGKTNTVMVVSRGVYDAKIPLLIIEPSKKDYWHLSSDMRDMKIFSFGKDAELLKINPFIPEEGTIIVNHVDSLLHAFSGAFDMEAPTLFALDGLMKYAYKHHGWNMSDVTYYSDRSFPKIEDMLFLLPQYVDSNLPYGEEVKRNILGSLVNRLSLLNTGIIGESANSSRFVTGRELCSGTVLIELDDLSLETKPFVSMLIMIKVEQFLRSQDASSVLKNVIVLEEAHNIFVNVSDNAVSSTKKMASNFFSNMLSQIREYGTGIVIADQGPSQINDAAVSNTKTKVIHSIVNSNDIEKISFALNLTEVQKRVFPTLNAGEAVVSVRGNHIVSRIAVNRIHPEKIENMGCLFCPKRYSCDRFNRADFFDIPRQMMYAQELYNVRYNPVQVKQMVDILVKHSGWQSDYSLCLLGQLLSDETMRCGVREKRRMIRAYLDMEAI